MIESPPFWFYAVGFLLLLGPLVTVHELGHYLVGRWCGVKAAVFSVGFGKEIAGFTDRRGTRWRLSALPLAYVGTSNEWESAVLTAGCATAFFKQYDEANEENVTDFLAFSTANSSSIRNCFEMARSNARAKSR